MKTLKTVNNQVIVKCVITDVNKKGLPICALLKSMSRVSDTRVTVKALGPLFFV